MNSVEVRVDDELFQSLRLAFPTHLLTARPLTNHRCEECDETDRLLGGRTWVEVVLDLPAYCHDVFPLLTDEARRYHLPAYLLTSLGPDGGLQGESVLSAIADGRISP